MFAAPRAGFCPGLEAPGCGAANGSISACLRAGQGSGPSRDEEHGIKGEFIPIHTGWH